MVLWFLVQPHSLLACRYNVRDVGFVDFGTEAYHLYVFVQNNTPPDFISLLQTLPSSALRASNVEVELINTDEQKQHPALTHLPAGTQEASPVAVLVSPDGPSLRLPILKPDQPFGQTLASALDAIVSSPKREEILGVVGRAFAAVLLIEGESEEANVSARKAISEAIDQIRAQMKSMPKNIAHPPEMIALGPKALLREEILLWSLHQDTKKTREPRAAVLYGKARWIGPLMRGAEISVRNLTGILSIIGADCECGLDISWTQGTRLPVRWNAERHAQVAKALGFDPENPLVKVEVSRIIGRYGVRTREATQPETTSEKSATSSAGYQPVPSGDSPDGRKAHPNRGAEAADQGSSETVLLGESTHLLKRSVYFTAGLAVTIVAVGLAIVWRAARKKRLEQ
ncbi:MAG: hypothetical protein HY735_00935 [Verrucomicrobia bacterium]|nr:hypothetical protein [Verrucomicrobiota bacterium]